MDWEIKGALELGVSLVLMWAPLFVVAGYIEIPMLVLYAMPPLSVFFGVHAILRIRNLFSFNDRGEN